MLIPNIAISSKGEVGSVLLLGNCEIEKMKTIALPSDSATSVALLKYLLDLENYEPQYVEMGPDLESMLANCDGCLLIGDRALEAAKNLSLDLVQVSPSDADPVVCKLLDYGKYIFARKKNIGSNKTKVKRNTTKEIKFRPSTDVGDYNIKLKKIKRFILDGDKTKISVRFRGREILNSDMGLALLNKLRDELEEISQVDQEPSLEGRQLLMVLSPLKKNK